MEVRVEDGKGTAMVVWRRHVGGWSAGCESGDGKAPTVGANRQRQQIAGEGANETGSGAKAPRWKLEWKTGMLVRMPKLAASTGFGMGLEFIPA